MTFFILLLFYFNNAKAQSDNCAICGNWKWEKNDSQTFFTLRIRYKNNMLFGKHCYTLNNGSKVDCASLPSDTTFIISDYKFSDTLIVDVTSSFSYKKGKAKIYLSNGKLFWELFKEPTGEYYFPQHAILVK